MKFFLSVVFACANTFLIRDHTHIQEDPADFAKKLGRGILDTHEKISTLFKRYGPFYRQQKQLKQKDIVRLRTSANCLNTLFKHAIHPKSVPAPEVDDTALEAESETSGVTQRLRELRKQAEIWLKEPMTEEKFVAVTELEEMAADLDDEVQSQASTYHLAHSHDELTAEEVETHRHMHF